LQFFALLKKKINKQKKFKFFIGSAVVEVRVDVKCGNFMHKKGQNVGNFCEILIFKSAGSASRGPGSGL
jgi:hypothetical protein